MVLCSGRCAVNRAAQPTRRASEAADARGLAAAHVAVIYNSVKAPSLLLCNKLLRPGAAHERAGAQAADRSLAE